MQNRSIDNLSRRAASNGTRRGLFEILSAPGLATAFTGQLTAEADVQASKNKKKKKKNQKRCPRALDLCETQAQSCTTILTAQCGGNASCLDGIACCSFLATCDSSGFFACLVAASG